MKALLYRNIVILIYVLLLPLVGFAQRAGDLDRSFNYGRGENYAFNYGDGPSNNFSTTPSIYSTVLQADGKIIIGGSFTNFNGTAINRIARLNSDGSLDTAFNTGIGANNPVRTTSVQADGKIIIGGEFTSFNGSARNYIARLNTDGSLDAAFNPGTGADGSVRTIAVQADGKIIIGGSFITFNGTPRNRIARLNADGSLDATFNPSTGANIEVRTTSLQADGKIIIGGDFTFFNGTARNRIARLNADGSLDATFNPSTGANGSVLTTAVQVDGKIIIGGQFVSFNGTTRNYLARLNADGSLDANFNIGAGANNVVWTTALQADGKIIIEGFFTTFNGTARNRIARLNADGSLDATFNPGIGANDAVLTTAVQADGKIIIGGGFTFYNGTARNRIARLNTDGSLDATFNPGSGANNSISIIALQVDGKIIIGGGFNSYNGINRNRIARLNANGSLDASFNPGIGVDGQVNSISLQPDGKIIIGGLFGTYNGIVRSTIARLNADGSLDNTFNAGTVANNRVQTTAIQADGKIIIGGFFDTYNSAARNRIARLNFDGSLDTTFTTTTGASNTVRSITLQPDGKIIMGGDFLGYNNFSTPYIARIHSVDCPISVPILVTGNTSFCFGESTILTSSQLTGNLWNTGDTTRSIVVTSPGEYTVRTMNNGCTSSFSGIIRVTTLDSIITPNISGDTSLCAGTSTRLTSSSPTGNLWSTGDTTNTITISTPGYYTVRKITGICTSAVSSPLAVRFEISTPTISGDSTICSGNTTRLTSSSPTGNLWSTGDTTQFINVAQAGNYSVRVINGGCTSAVSAPFRVVNAGPSPTVINFDTTSNRCLGARLQLTPAGNFAHYQWNTGERTRSIYTRTSGQYSVQVANSDSCFGLPSPPIFITFDTNWCSVEIFRVGLDSITANVWADYYIWYLDGIELLSSNTLKTIPIQGDGVYTFRAVNGGRMSTTSNPIVITSAKRSLVTKFEVYPNPATNKVTVNTSGTGTLEILNNLGQVVITQPATATNELNLSQLAKGVYTVRFNGASKMLVVK